MGAIASEARMAFEGMAKATELLPFVYHVRKWGNIDQRSAKNFRASDEAMAEALLAMKPRLLEVRDGDFQSRSEVWQATAEKAKENGLAGTPWSWTSKCLHGLWPNTWPALDSRVTAKLHVGPYKYQNLVEALDADEFKRRVAALKDNRPFYRIADILLWTEGEEKADFES